MADSKISALTALSAAPASGDLLVMVDVSDTTMAVSGTDKKITYANLTSALTSGATTFATASAQTFTNGIAVTDATSALAYDSDGSDPTVGAMLVTRTATGVAANPLATALFKNTSEVAGGSDYQNEVHVWLQAGTAANHRRYINFVNYGGTDSGKLGFNAKNVFITYDDGSGTHRLWFENTVDSPNDTGNSYISSAGTGSVIINGLADTANEGTGGLIVRTGGGTPVTAFRVTADGQMAIGLSTTLNTRYTATVGGNHTLASGSGQGGLYVNPTYTPASASSSVFNGMFVNPITAGSFNANQVSGFQGVATHNASAALTTLQGGNFIAQNLVAQTVSTAYGAQFQIQNTNASGTITTAAGVYVAAPSNSGTLTNYYGVRVLDAAAASLTVGFRGGITAGSGKYNAYFDGTAQNYMAGNLGVGTGASTPATVLDVRNSDSGTNAVVNIAQLDYTSSGTPDTGFGLGLYARLKSSTTANQAAGRLTWEWATATHASRAVKGKLTAYYTSTEREAITWVADSAGVNVGIGESSPTLKLHVSESNVNATGVRITNSESSGELSLYSAGNTAFGIASWVDAAIVESGTGHATGLVLSAYDGTLAFQTNARTTRMTLTETNGYLGLGTTSPQGLLHGHDGSGGFLFVNQATVGGTLVTVIPDAAGDVTEKIFFVGWCTNSAPFSADVAPTTLAVSSSTTKTDGTNTLTIAVTAGGAFTLQATGGAATWNVNLWVFWR